MSIIRVVDISASAGVPPDSWFERIKQAPYNISAIIIQCWMNTPRWNYPACAAKAERYFGPGNWATYCWPPPDWEQALAYVKQHLPLVPHFMVLDVEKPADVPVERCRIKHEHLWGLQAAGMPAWVYSSIHEWSVVMNNDPTFAAYDQWAAWYYHTTPQLFFPDSMARVGFGGVSIPKGHQVEGTYYLEGIPVDLSVFESTAFGLNPEEAPMTPQERQEFDALKIEVTRLKALVGTAGVFGIAQAKALLGRPLTAQEHDEAKGLLP